MKKVVYLIVIAAFALVACEPNNGIENKVSIGVSLDEGSQSSKGQQRISAIDNVDKIDINWEEGDVLYYAADESQIDNNKYFTLISGEDSKTAVFECNNFAYKGEMFNLYYHGLADPLNTQDNGVKNPNFGNPIPLNQECTLKNGKTVINNDYLVYKGINCKIGRGIKLEPDFCIIGMQLQGEGDFSQHVAVGTDFEGEENTTSYLCEMGTVNLANNPIYYFVLPANYSLENNKIGLATSRGHNSSSPLDLPNNELKPGIAQIFKVKVTKNPSQSSTNDEYIIEAIKTTNP